MQHTQSPATRKMTGAVLILSLALWACSGPAPTAVQHSGRDTGQGQTLVQGQHRFDPLPGGTGFASGSFSVGDGTTFRVSDGAMQLPPTLALQKGVAVTMDVETLPDGTMRFTFGPPGATFNPPAEVDVSWIDAQSANLKLRYLDPASGAVEQPEEDVEVGTDQVTLKIHHFSQYELDDE